MKRLTASVLLTVLVAAACAGDAGETVATEPPTTTTAAPTSTEAPTTTTRPPPTTTTAEPTTTTVAPVEIGISDEYVVETIAVIDGAATGGLSYWDGFLYHADFGWPGDDPNPGSRVFKVGLDGNVEVFSEPEDMLAGTGNTVGPDGLLYQSSFGSGRVFSITPDGTWTLVTDDLVGPTGIVVVEDGTIYVDDCRSNVVYRIPPGETPDPFARHTRFQCPNGLTIDDEGNLYVVNFQHGEVQVIRPNGDIEELYTFPSGLAHVVYHEGQLFITARREHVIYRYDLATGAVDIIAGQAGVAGTEDGPGNEATITRPNAITVGPDGTLYINHGFEEVNNPAYIRAIRKVEG